MGGWQDSMLADEIDQSQVYEDVLLIGQVCAFVCELVKPYAWKCVLMLYICACAWRCVLMLNICAVFQEKCVEDWPEDSPELNPEWKPVRHLQYTHICHYLHIIDWIPTYGWLNYRRYRVSLFGPDLVHLSCLCLGGMEKSILKSVVIWATINSLTAWTSLAILIWFLPTKLLLSAHTSCFIFWQPCQLKSHIYSSFLCLMWPISVVLSMALPPNWLTG